MFDVHPTVCGAVWQWTAFRRWGLTGRNISLDGRPLKVMTYHSFQSWFLFPGLNNVNKIPPHTETKWSTLHAVLGPSRVERQNKSLLPIESGISSQGWRGDRYTTSWQKHTKAIFPENLTRTQENRQYKRNDHGHLFNFFVITHRDWFFFLHKCKKSWIFHRIMFSGVRYNSTCL